MIIPAEKSAGQNSAYSHLNMKGAFGSEGAFRFSYDSIVGAVSAPHHPSDGRRPPLQDVVQTREQVRYGRFSFVAHVGKAKSLATKLAVTRVDHKMMFFA